MLGVELGYARVSTVKQDIDRQVDALTTARTPTEQIYLDKKSGAPPVRLAGDLALACPSRGSPRGRASLACQRKRPPGRPARVLFSDMTPKWSPGPVAEGQRRWAVVS